jgi:hypothetical protein
VGKRHGVSPRSANMLQLACSYVLVLLETPLKLVPPPGSLLQLLVHFIPVPVKTSFYMTCNLPSMMPSYPLVFSPWLARWNTGQPTDYKARCVAKGCSQIEGVDFNELFAAVAHRDTVWVFISLVDHHDLECDQLSSIAILRKQSTSLHLKVAIFQQTRSFF